MKITTQMSLPIFVVADEPALKVKLTLPQNLIDVTGTGKVVGFKCAVAITNTLYQALQPDGSVLGYYEKLLNILDVAHMQFTMGGTLALKLCFKVAIATKEGECRMQFFGAYRALYGEPVLVVGIEKNL